MRLNEDGTRRRCCWSTGHAPAPGVGTLRERSLAARGIGYIAVDLPTVGAGTDPMFDCHTDATHVRAVLGGLDGPVVLCGNSYGGVVITEASAGSANVARLVYLAAFMVDADEELPGSLLGDCFPEFVAGVAFDDDGPATPDPEMTKERSFQAGGLGDRGLGSGPASSHGHGRWRFDQGVWSGMAQHPVDMRRLQRRWLDPARGAERDVQVMAHMALTRMGPRIAELRLALEGRFDGHHGLMLSMHLGHVDQLTSAIDRLDAGGGSRDRPVRWAGRGLCTIPGIGQRVAEVVIAKIGVDMGRSPREASGVMGRAVPGHRSRPGNAARAKPAGVTPRCERCCARRPGQRRDPATLTWPPDSAGSAAGWVNATRERPSSRSPTPFL